MTWVQDPNPQLELWPDIMALADVFSEGEFAHSSRYVPVKSSARGVHCVDQFEDVEQMNEGPN